MILSPCKWIVLSSSLIFGIASGIWSQTRPPDPIPYSTILLDSAERIKWTDPARTLRIAEVILDSLIPAPDTREHASIRIEAFLHAANSGKMLSNKAKAVHYASRAISESKAARNDTLLVAAFFMKASIFGQYDDHDSAFVYYQLSAEHFKPGMNVYYYSNALTGMGEIHAKIGNNEKAEEYLLKGYAASKEDEYAWMFSMATLINFYSDQRNPKYIPYLDTFAMSDFYRNASETSIRAHFDSFLRLENSAPEQREKKLREVFDFSKLNSAYVNQVGYGMKLNEHYTNQKQWEKGHALLLEILPIAQKSANGRRIFQVYQLLYDNARQRGDWKEALTYLELYGTYRDSILAEENREMINELNIQFEVAEKDHEIEQQAQKIENAARNRRYLLLLTGLAGALAIVSFIYFRSRTKSAHQIARQAEIIHATEKERLKKEHEVSQLTASLDAQERERNRIARDLHDGLGSMMSGISAQIEHLISRQPDNTLYPPLKSIVKETASELRRTSYELMPAKLLRMGLEPAIRDLCINLIVKNGMELNLELSPNISHLSPDRQLIVYRIVQELLHNIVKHASARHVLVQLSAYDNEMTLVVEDDGKGFDVNGSSGSGIGMSSIRSRVDVLGGLLDVASIPGEGTTVTLNFPIEN